MKKKIIPLIFTSFLTGGCFLGVVDAFGNKEQAIEIGNVEQFMEMVNSTKESTTEYTLTADIDLDGATINKEDRSSKSVGVKLNGNGHKISNAQIISSYNASFFGQLAYSEIKNLVFDNISVIGKNPAIVASVTKSSGEFDSITINENCVIGDGTSDYAGGIIGNSEYQSNKGAPNITNCVNKGTVTGLNYVGGLIGCSAGKLSENVNYGTIVSYGESYVGGIVGYGNTPSQHNLVKGNKNYGNVSSATASYVGGVAGMYDNDINSNYYEVSFDGNKNYGNVTGVDNVGGVLGASATHSWSGLIESTPTNCILITSCSNYGTVKGKKYVGGVAGSTSGDKSDHKATKYAISYTFCSNLKNDANDNYVQGEERVGGIAGNGAIFKNCKNETPVKLSKKAGFQAGSNVYDSEQYGIAGIVGAANGSFACEISSCENSGDISGYKEENQYYGSVSSLGGIVGCSYGGSFINNKSSGLLDGTCCIGGIVGSLIPKFTTTMSNQTFEGTMNFDSMAGGLIGYSVTTSSENEKATISNAKVDMKGVKTRGGYLGGYVGYAYGYSELNDKYYEKINIINSSSTFTYYKNSTTSTGFIQKDVGGNGISLNNMRSVVLDETSANNASCTLLGTIPNEE